MELSRSDELLRDLIRINTVNDVNPEKPCIDYIKTLLDEAEIETRVFAKTPDRPNLFARIPADESAEKIFPPVLLFGHVDVVPVDGQEWSQPPFDAEVKDGYIWGRGAIDMKGEVAMFLSLALEMAEKDIRFPFEIRFMFVSDEEGAGTYGAKYLVAEHKELFEGIKWAFGEIGGFSIALAGKKFYPVMIAEKQFSHIKVTASGQGGHGSLSYSGTAMERAAKAILQLSTAKLPVRVTPAVRLMINGFGDALGGVQKIALKQLLKPAMTDRVLKMLGKAGELFDPLLHNNVNVTIVKGGSAINVIPSQVSFECDLRLVPGCSMEQGIEDVKSIIGNDFTIEVVGYDKGGDNLDVSKFDKLAEAILRKDPQASPIPFVLSGVTDGRFLSSLGIQTYGFTPMEVPEDFDFTALAHAADEKIPVGATDFGREVLMDYFQNGYCAEE